MSDRDANERLAGSQPYLGTSLPVRIKADGTIVVRCEVGVTPNVYVAEDYDEATGTATFRTGPENVAPAMTNCGQWTELLNSVLGLPAVANSVLVTTIVDEQGEPLRLR